MHIALHDLHDISIVYFVSELDNDGFKACLWQKHGYSMQLLHIVYIMVNLADGLGLDTN